MYFCGSWWYNSGLTSPISSNVFTQFFLILVDGELYHLHPSGLLHVAKQFSTEKYAYWHGLDLFKLSAYRTERSVMFIHACACANFCFHYVVSLALLSPPESFNENSQNAHVHQWHYQHLNLQFTGYYWHLWLVYHPALSNILGLGHLFELTWWITLNHLFIQEQNFECWL